MANYSNVSEVKARLAELGQKLLNRDYETIDDKNKLYRERYILKQQLAALERGSTSYFIDWLDKKEG